MPDNQDAPDGVDLNKADRVMMPQYAVQHHYFPQPPPELYSNHGYITTAYDFGLQQPAPLLTQPQPQFHAVPYLVAPPLHGYHQHAPAAMNSFGPLPSAIPAAVPHDPSGQIQPPGMKPRVTTTLWEDEGTLCFQVEAKGVCVARREDNDMVNGTKLLNVAGMTRGRRDGILKSERHRHVVKVGAMHLKGVWIPYERALDFANKEKIVDLLYPLFVTDIKTFLYHPANYARTAQVMAAAERRRLQVRQEDEKKDKKHPFPQYQQQYQQQIQSPQSVQAVQSVQNQMQMQPIQQMSLSGQPGVHQTVYRV